jgi:hypothetical protein
VRQKPADEKNPSPYIVEGVSGIYRNYLAGDSDVLADKGYS